MSNSKLTISYSSFVLMLELNGRKKQKYQICKLRWVLQNLMAKPFSLNDISGML